MESALTENKIKKHNFYLPLIILFIFGDIICDNYVLQSFNKEPSTMGFSLFLGILVLQIIASPLQAGFSDFYCRKKSLLISLIFSFFSLLFAFIFDQTLFFPILFIVLLFKGALGNTIPLSWAAIADTQEKNFRFSLALSTCAYALGYLTIALFKKYLTEEKSNLASLFLYIILILLCLIIFRDIRDKQNPKNHAGRISFFNLAINEISLLFRLLHEKSLRQGLFAFLLWETSLYSILILLVDFESQYPNTAISMMLGYLTGILIMKFCKNIKDERMIRIGYFISILFLLLFFILFSLKHSMLFILPFCYFFYAIGNAFLSPTILSLLSKERKTHEQGKIFGFIESADTIGFLFASITIIIFKLFQIELIHMIIFSFASFAISWLPYSRFEKFKAFKT